MTDDLKQRLRKVEPDEPGERTRWYRNPDGLEAANRIEELEAAIFSIYVAPNDIPFIKAQIDAVLDVNECRKKWGERNDQP